MFIRWSVDKVKRRANLKTSLLAKVKALALKSMPNFQDIVNEIFPRKTPVIVHHLEAHAAIYSVDGKPVLIDNGKDCVFPFLKIAIEYQGLLKSVYCYDEAVVALLRGAALMARGPWGTDDTFLSGDVVQICLVGTDIAFAIGIMMMSGEQISTRPDGVAVDVLHLLGDGLWVAKSI
jgi:PUA domain protein